MSQSLDRLIASSKAAVAEIADLKSSNVTLAGEVKLLTDEVSRLTAEAGTPDAALDAVSSELEAAVPPPPAPAAPAA